MKEIKYSYRLLLNQIRKHDQKYKQIAISGEEIFIPTRWGEVRALLYRPVLTDICGPENRKYPVLFDFHGGGFVFGLPEADDRFCRKISCGNGPCSCVKIQRWATATWLFCSLTQPESKRTI